MKRKTSVKTVTGRRHRIRVNRRSPRLTQAKEVARTEAAGAAQGDVALAVEPLEIAIWLDCPVPDRRRTNRYPTEDKSSEPIMESGSGDLGHLTTTGRGAQTGRNCPNRCVFKKSC